jgi:AAA+ ATPase superfamily predicted ATPase
MIRFINRKNELETLEKDWISGDSGFIVVFGRRRIGKTRLLEEFLKDKDGVKHISEDVNKKIQITELRQSLGKYLEDDFLLNQEIEDWGLLFSYLSKTLPKDRRMFIWIDEFSYLVKNDRSLTSVMQKFCDGFLRRSKVVLIVSGSIFGLMNEDVLSQSSPLYGRRTRDMLLKALGFKHMSEFLPFSFEDSLKTAFTISGIPEYLEVASRRKTYREFISDEFFRTDGYFYREPYYLLSQEFKEIKTYLSILNAIAYGNSRPTEIANYVGIKGREIYPYLELLIAYGFVGRETSIQDSKRGVYHIKDNFLDFWFNLVHRNREAIERDAYKPGKEELSSYFGKRFEIFIRENANLFFKGYGKTGRWWHADKEIDVIALDEKSKRAVFAECKWRDEVEAERLVEELAEKASHVQWHKEDREETYAVFARSFSSRIKRYEGKRVSCFDLDDIRKVILK